jgi:hypothetical protein
MKAVSITEANTDLHRLTAHRGTCAIAEAIGGSGLTWTLRSWLDGSGRRDLFRAPSRMRRLRPSDSLGVLLNYDSG